MHNVLSAVGGDGALSSADFFLALRGGTGQDRDLPVLLGDGAAGESKTEHEGQSQSKQLLHK